ncbi:MAG: BofC C-terminal domain-containing protein [Oscillospiraceae bacterium]|jgi:hypothetical protein|nr:BofC C-terminal domain-containing protein [Oscillospiraceae bacterium]
MTANRQGTAARRVRSAPAKGALAALAVGLAAALVLASPLPSMIGAQHSPKDAGVFARIDSNGDPGYIIKADEGKVAVFMPPGTDPVIVTEIDVSTLRAHDRKLLENGIEIESYEKLIQSLEDFDA